MALVDQRWQDAAPVGALWADADEDTGGNEADEKQAQLPPPQVSTDADGVTTTVSYSHNDNGELVRTITKTRKVKRTRKTSKNAIRRKQMVYNKFGLCKNKPPGPEKSITAVSIDPINFESVNAPPDEKDDGAAKVQRKCRNCGEVGHFTLACPKKKRAGLDTEMGPPPSDDTPEQGGGIGGGGGGYVPPHLRKGAQGAGGFAGSSMADDLPVIRVTNISEDTTEKDLGELFRPFGSVVRLRLAKNKQTGISRGFAFVTFSNRDDAQNAIDKLQNYKYDHLVLHLDWSKSLAERNAEQAAKAAGLSTARSGNQRLQRGAPVGGVNAYRPPAASSSNNPPPKRQPGPRATAGGAYLPPSRR